MFKFPCAIPSTFVTLAVISSSLPVLGEEWRRYTNTRLGASVEYPAHLVMGGPITDLTDGLPGAATRQPTGITFSSEDGIEVSIYGVMAVESPYVQMCENMCEGETYALKRPKLAVVSGCRGDFIYYRRCRSDANASVLHCFYLTYPSSRQSEMQKVIERMTLTLR